MPSPRLVVLTDEELYVCQNCGRLAPMRGFQDQCGCTHGCLIRVEEVAALEQPEGIGEAMVERGLRATYGDHYVDKLHRDFDEGDEWLIERQYEMRRVLEAALHREDGEG